MKTKVSSYQISAACVKNDPYSYELLLWANSQLVQKGGFCTVANTALCKNGVFYPFPKKVAELVAQQSEYEKIDHGTQWCHTQASFFFGGILAGLLLIF